jgi:membrane protease YdiL (CAAX protease family)
MEAKQIEIKALFISLAAVVFIEAAARMVISPGLGYPMIILGGARLVETGLIILCVLVWGKGFPSIGLTQSTIVPGFRKGLMWSAGFAVVAFLAFVVLFVVGIDPLSLIYVRLPAKHSETILYFLVGGMVAPLAEEIFFRGMLYGFLRRWGIVVAVVLSTLMFVLAHPIFPGIPLPQVVGGIVFAVAYEIEGSLMVPITIHVLGNLAIFTLSLMS